MSINQTDIEKFDRAVHEYLSDITDKVVYAPTQTAIKLITKQEKFSDKKPWNFISFYREPLFDIDWSRMNNPMTVVGDMDKLINMEDNSQKLRYVQSIPVNLTYRVEIWASKSIEVQQLAISLISKLYMQEQVLKVPINPDGEDGRFHILDVAWNDNSDLERETDIGKIYRHTINFTVDARILLIRHNTTKRVNCALVDIYENLDKYTDTKEEKDK